MSERTVFQAGEQKLMRHPVPSRPPQRTVRRRQIVLGARTYTAFDAHELLSLESEGSLARPGKLV